MSEITVSTVPCPVAIRAVRGDYFAIRVEVANDGCPNPIDLDAYNWGANVWEITRRIDESNPCGGIVKVGVVLPFKIELMPADTPPVVVLTLSPSQTETLKTGCEYFWDLKWWGTSVESQVTFTHGTLRVEV